MRLHMGQLMAMTVVGLTLSAPNGSAISRAPAQSPVPVARFGHQMVYDAAQNQTIMFGGAPSTSVRSRLSDTWAWDGARWKLLHTDGPGRMDAVMAYDEARRRILLFGGSGEGGKNLADTWEWNGTQWDRVATEGPGERVHPSMAYDAGRRRVVLHGGFGPTGERTDTWEWEGNRWALREESGGTAVMVLGYDIADNHLLGLGYAGNSEVTSMWSWTGSSWEKLRPAKLPTGEPPIRMTYQDSVGLILVDGGFRSTAATWVWRDAKWSSLPGANPPSRIGFDVAFDARRGRTVLFGGLGPGEVPRADLWELGPGGWKQIGR
jgi:hypothetical protein